jgi:hypothetical protein
MSFSRKPTCAFCEHEQNGRCEKKDTVVKLSKHRRCKSFAEDRLKMVAEKLRKKAAIDRRIEEKRTVKIWEQSPSFYKELWDKHYLRVTPKAIRDAKLPLTQEEQEAELAIMNIPKYIARVENVTYED